MVTVKQLMEKEGNLFPEKSPAALPPMTPDQQKVHDSLVGYVTGKTGLPNIFTAYAGCGKTFTMSHFTDTVKKLGCGKIMMTAPTHKAVKVMRKAAVQGVEYRTLHSALALREQTNHFTGEKTYEPEKNPRDAPPIAGIQILGVDETSMLTDDVFKYLAPWVQKGLKVIFIGDPFQIPPVKHIDCIPFRHGEGWGMPWYKLTEIMRQKNGNPIIEYVTEIRDNPLAASYDPREHLLENGTGISLVQTGSSKEATFLKELFTDGAFKRDSDFAKVVAWRNNTVNTYNDLIRSGIYQGQGHLANIMLGEKLIMDKPFIINARMMLTTNEEVEVVEIHTMNKQFKWLSLSGSPETANWKVYNVRVEWETSFGKQEALIPIIHEESRSEYFKMIETLKNEALNAPFTMKGKMWKQHYGLIEQTAWTKYNYAVTSHNAQGSTYQNAMVLQWDIAANWTIAERNRILYTACTRAADTLTIEV